MAKQPQDDLFEGGSMSFGEHLEELRVCLFRSIFGMIIGCLIGLYAADRIVNFFQSPLEQALTKHYLNRALKGITADFKGSPPEEYKTTIIDGHLIPEKMNVEPGQVISAISGAHPGLTGDARVVPSAFIPSDFRENQDLAFVNLLADQAESKTASPARRIWQSLTEDQQKLLQAWAKAGQPLTVAERTQLLAMLNEVAAKSELHTSAEFANLIGTNEDLTKNLRKELAEKESEETTRRLNKSLIAGAFSDQFRKPQVNLVTFYNWRPVKVRYQVLNAQEAFMIYLKASLVSGIVLASPWIFYQIWIFVAAGLYPHEKNQVFLYLPISMLLFLAGASLAFTFVFQPVLDFLFQFNEGLNAEFDPRIGEWLSFVLILPLGFGISFQLPLVMLFINRLGLVTVDLFMQQWRMAILIIFLVAMVLTPADPVSMLLMAIPLCGLYVLGIAMCIWMPQNRSPFTAAYEPSA
ncbi:twin-arginine translocase subunit TatC [Anatilimnocola sp. NA78]|uniref:twin-arginine translocase subunit TatC n=1 Tax=Anatilimnocola sp. NA78 TaxID=3415683 RepID=UPI003CE4A5E5